MPVDPFDRMARGVLNRLGQDALLLRMSTVEQVACRVNIERGVQVMGPHSDATFVRDVATLLSELGACSGDQLQHPKGIFALDGLLSDNGYTQRFTVQVM